MRPEPSQWESPGRSGVTTWLGTLSFPPYPVEKPLSAFLHPRKLLGVSWFYGLLWPVTRSGRLPLCVEFSGFCLVDSDKKYTYDHVTGTEIVFY